MTRIPRGYSNRWLAMFRKHRPAKALSRVRPLRSLLETLEDRRLLAAAVWTDKLDYAPDQTAHIFGSGYQVGESIRLEVVRTDGIPQDSLDNPWTITDGGAGDLDGAADGKFQTTWYVDPGYAANQTLVVSALGLTSGLVASATFTDSSVGTYDQCSNDDGDGYATGDTGCRWINGNMQKNNSTIFEHDATVQRLWLTGLTAGAHTITLQYGTTKGGNHAYDFLTTWNHSENWIQPADLCQDIVGISCAPAGASTLDIPNDPNVDNTSTPNDTNGAEPVGPGERQFVMFGGTLNSATNPSIVSGSYAGDSDTAITISFSTTGNQVLLVFGAHVSAQEDWGPGQSAVDIPGSPYHVQLAAIDGTSIGQRDNQMQSAAVVPTATLTLLKQVINDHGGTAVDANWTLSAAGPTPISGVEGDADITNAIVNPGVYALSESGGPAGYAASLYSCIVNGGAPVSGNSLTLEAGDAAVCTIINNDIQPTLTLVKTVNNNNGGALGVSDFPLFVNATGVTSGVVTGFNAGNYTASETQQPGYVASVWGGDCAANGSVTLNVGDNKTCTITNDDQQAFITVVKVVTNNNGGSAEPNDFDLTLEGDAVLSGVAVPVNPGTYTAGETLLAGYSFVGFSGDCNSDGDTTVALGESKTCTLTNDDQQAYITVVKVVTNNNGGSAEPNDFDLTLEGDAVLSGVAVPVNPGTYTAGETLLAGYSFVGFSGDCNSDGDTTVALGESKTCTLTNDDQQAYITVVKVVTNNNGGSAEPNDFDLTLEGDAVLSGVAVPVNPGTYTAGETLLAGYSFVGFSGDCNSDGDTTVALGESKTCTLTNDDQQAFITVVKVVTNNNGGSAEPNDFDLTLEGDAVLSGVAVPVNPGTYTAGETLLAGYSFVGFSGDCNSDGDTTVALGESKTCTLTNDDIQPTLTLIKTVINDHGGTLDVSDFPLFVDATGVASGVATGFNAGSYTASETQQPGYAASVWGGDCAADGSVTLNVGDSKTCTITNDDIQPQLKLVKIVVNGFDGLAVVDDFQASVSGGDVVWDVFVGLNAGNYQAAETTLPGYDPSPWVGDCAADGSVTLSVGDIKTCTITNTLELQGDLPPLVSIDKTVENDEGDFVNVAVLPGPPNSNLTYKYVLTSHSEPKDALAIQLTDDNGTPGDTTDDVCIVAPVGTTAVLICPADWEDTHGPIVTADAIYGATEADDPDPDGDGRLDPEETWTVIASFRGVAQNETTINNVATVRGTDEEGSFDDATDDATVLIVEESLITSSSLCEYDVDNELAGDQFRLIYTLVSSGSYRITASNPGQFYYNGFYTAGDADDEVELSFTIPYPFITKGANPLHVYSSYTIGSNGNGGRCVEPGDDITGNFTYTVDGSADEFSPSGHEKIVLGDYDPLAPGSATKVTIKGIVPASERIYVNIHLDYGLKGTNGWSRVNGAGDADATAENAKNTAGVADYVAAGSRIDEPQSYPFQFDASSPGDPAVSDDPATQSINEWKKGQGVLNQVVNAANSNPLAGLTLQLVGPAGTTIETQTTDQDGYTYFKYKHTGKAATYKVRIAEYGVQQSFELKANGFVIVNFSLLPLGGEGEDASLEALEWSTSLDDSVSEHVTVLSSWNQSQPLDANVDGRVTSQDALAVINHLNSGLLEGGANLDSDGSGSVTARDALSIINHLNAGLDSVSAEGADEVFAGLSQHQEELFSLGGWGWSGTSGKRKR